MTISATDLGIQPLATSALHRAAGVFVRDGLVRKHRRARADHVAAYVRELATLLSVGTPLVEALPLVAQGRRGSAVVVGEHLRRRVLAGSSLGGAMAELPWFFDDLCVQLVRVGEESGALDVTLKRLADFKQRSAQLRGKLGTAVLYPAIVLAMAMIVTAFLMTFVVPSILEPLVDLGKPLPWPTRVVQTASDLVLGWWWLLLLLAGTATAGLTILFRTDRGQELRDRWLLRLPVFGALASKAVIVRISIVLSTLLRSGVPMLQALETAERTTGNRTFAAGLRRCGQAIRRGQDVGPAVDATGLFPPLVVQVLSIGQESGQIEDMLDQLATEYDSQVAQSAQRLSVVLEPVLILILAAVVLLIALATMLPILEAGDVLA